MDRKIWKSVTHFDGIGEATPFEFKGKKYLLFNLSGINQEEEKGNVDRAVIRELDTGNTLCEILPNHYFISAYVANGKCYCFGSYVGEHPGQWRAHKINMICSDDLIHWSEPKCILDYPLGCVYNTGTIFGGERYIMLFETDDRRFPIFTFRFLESKDLENWTLMDKAIYGDKKYVGGPAIYYIPEDKMIYITYVNEFINEETRQVNYDTCIARTRDLVHWEEGNRPILFPDYEHKPSPEKHPDVYEINASDAEFIEQDGKVIVYYCGGNQMGIGDAAKAEYEGTLAQLFQEFFKPYKRQPTAQEFLEMRKED